ncbi:MAG: phospholipase D family protein [Lysobacteraceae bacterium]
MKWLRTFVLLALVLAAVGVAIRLVARLPTLDDRSASTAFTQTADTTLGRALAPAIAAHPGLTGIHLLDDGRAAFASRVLLARAAERSIDVQYYIWHGDITGTLLFDELRRAADRGVRVRLLQDDNTTLGLDRTLAALDAHRNIEVRLFNPFVIRSPRWIGYLTDFPRLNRRMHNKSFTVDNQATIVGGRNIGDEYFGAGDGSLFVDLDALAVGAVVGDVSRDFDRYWASASAYPAAAILPPVAPDALEDFAAAAARLRDSGAAQRYVQALASLPLATRFVESGLSLRWAPVRMVSDDPAKALGRAPREGLLISRLDQLLQRPTQRLQLVSGYFVPTNKGVDGFIAMAGRGVRLDIITNALEATDVPIVHAGYADHRKPLLRAGVRLWELRHEAGALSWRDVAATGSAGSVIGSSGAALHAKTFTVDGERVFIGSFNFAPRSAHLNTELGFVIGSAELTQAMSQRLDEATPLIAYEVRLSPRGDLVWIERRPDGTLIEHQREPGAGFWQRAAVKVFSWLPIEWLL